MSEGNPGRLSFEEIEGHIAQLADSTLERLAEGPLPADKDDGHDCRVCMVLGQYSHGIVPAAEALKTWHEFFDETPKLDAVTKGWRSHPGTEEERHEVRSAAAEWKTCSGAYSYARCCTIYFAARAELERRRRERVEEGLDIHGEPPDERDADERRQDEAAEDAERRLDAERIGDL